MQTLPRVNRKNDGPCEKLNKDFVTGCRPVHEAGYITNMQTLPHKGVAVSHTFPARTRWYQRAAVAVLALPLVACAAQPTMPVEDEGRMSAARAGSSLKRPMDASLINEGGPVFDAPPVPTDNGNTLINEGGPVFAIPGEVIFPSYFRGDRTQLVILAEQLGGDRVNGIAPAPLQEDGTFTLRVPKDTGAFMASTVFIQDEYLFRMRSVVKPVEGGSILIDPTSTLVSAKLGQAYQRGLLLDLNKLAGPTIELTDNLRFSIPGEEWGRVQLDGDNLSLARALTALTSLRPQLETQVNAWDDLINEQPLRPRLKPVSELDDVPGGMPK
jgi:hypothetical protein